MECRWRVWWARRRARSVLVLVALAVLGALLAPAAPRRTHTRALVPRAHPARLAHLLADFTVHARLHPHIDAWSVMEESSNYTGWRYTVTYRCGARCVGRADVAAHSEPSAGAGGPQHGLRAHAHRVLVAHRACRTALLLPWPTICDEWQTDTVITSSGAGAGEPEGAWLDERAERRCGLARALAALLAGGDAWCGAAALLAERRRHLHQVQALVLEKPV